MIRINEFGDFVDETDVPSRNFVGWAGKSSGPRRGRASHGAYVDAADTIAAVMQMRDAGMNYREIAKRCGISPDSAFRLVHNAPRRVTAKVARKVREAVA